MIVGRWQEIRQFGRVERRRDAAGALPGDEHLGRVRVRRGEVGERRGGVDRTGVVDGLARGVLRGRIADVDVAGAVRHVDERAAGQRVALVPEVKDPAPPGRIVGLGPTVSSVRPARGISAPTAQR